MFRTAPDELHLNSQHDPPELFWHLKTRGLVFLEHPRELCWEHRGRGQLPHGGTHCSSLQCLKVWSHSYWGAVVSLKMWNWTHHREDAYLCWIVWGKRSPVFLIQEGNSVAERKPVPCILQPRVTSELPQAGMMSKPHNVPSCYPCGTGETETPKTGGL